ncbi:MAG: putative addiction module antidote protein [Alcanivorax sp.]|nr:putative addiction module antidote protein [Alcanivorax sp.]
MKTRLTAFDPAEYLDSPEAIAEFLAAAFETRDGAYIASAIGVAARAKGMTDIARETGLARQSLYAALSEKGNPRLDTLIKVLSTLGVDLSTKAHNPA